jgi:hypothetical protein
MPLRALLGDGHGMRVDQPWLGPLRCTDATAADAVVSAYLHACDCAGDAPSQRQLAAQFSVSRAESPPWLARSMGLLTWPAVSLRSAARRPGPARGGSELYYRGRSPAPSAAFVADGGPPGLTAPASPSLVMPEPVAIMAVQAARS